MKNHLFIISAVLLLSLTNAAFFDKAIDFNKGLVAGFVNRDLKASDLCNNVTYVVKEEIATIL